MQPRHAETMVRTYRKTKDYQRDAQSLAREGWQVAGVATRGVPGGCLVKLLFWWVPGALASLTEYVVTYSRLR